MVEPLAEGDFVAVVVGALGVLGEIVYGDAKDACDHKECDEEPKECFGLHKGRCGGRCLKGLWMRKRFIYRGRAIQGNEVRCVCKGIGRDVSQKDCGKLCQGCKGQVASNLPRVPEKVAVKRRNNQGVEIK